MEKYEKQSGNSGTFLKHTFPAELENGHQNAANYLITSQFLPH